MSVDHLPIDHLPLPVMILSQALGVVRASIATRELLDSDPAGIGFNEIVRLTSDARARRDALSAGRGL